MRLGRPPIVPFVLLLVAVHSHAAKECISILDFTVNPTAVHDVTGDAIQDLTQQVRDQATGMIDPARFEVMTRENILVMLPPGRKDLAECEGRCEVETARNIGARWHVVGDVKKVGRKLVLSIRLYDVRGGAELDGVRVEGADVDALSDDVASKARILLSRVPGLGLSPDVHPEGAVSGTGGIFVTLSDPDASLTLDGRPVAGRSPFLLEKVGAGTHVLTARSRSRFGVRKIDLKRDDLLKVDLQMREGFGVVKVQSDPAGAMVFLDSVFQGQTPIRMDMVPLGEHRLAVEKSGYLDSSVLVEVQQDSLAAMDLRLVEAGSLRLEFPRGMESGASGVVVGLARSGSGRTRDSSSLPGQVSPRPLAAGSWHLTVRGAPFEPLDTVVRIGQGQETSIPVRRHNALVTLSSPDTAEFWIDSIRQGIVRSDSVTFELAPGGHQLRASRACHEDWIRDLVAEPGSEVRLGIESRRRCGSVSVTADGAAHLSLDGKESLPMEALARGSARWSSSTIEPGKHRVSLVAEGRDPWLRDFELAAGGSVALEAKLQLTAEESRMRHNLARRAWRIGLGTASLASGLAAAYVQSLVTDADHRAAEARAQYASASSDFASYKSRYASARSDSRSAVQERSGFLIATGVFLACFGLTWGF